MVNTLLSKYYKNLKIIILIDTSMLYRKRSKKTIDCHESKSKGIMKMGLDVKLFKTSF